MSDLPEPMTASDCDVTNLDAFPLNVEKLFGSELWALASGDEFRAAVALWGRAWKQVPAASLPDDDRVLAAFSGAGAKWRKVKEMALRGFVLCSDGRLYHKTLASEATAAYARKLAFQKKRTVDAERLSKWRSTRSETPAETPNETRFNGVDETQSETRSETRFVAEGREGSKVSKKELCQSTEIREGPIFDEIWNEYPHPPNRGAKPIEKFAKLSFEEKTRFQQAIPLMKKKLDADRKRGFDRAPPMFSTYLNQRRWETEFEAAPAERERSGVQKWI